MIDILGYCFICGKETSFHGDLFNGRESFSCKHCNGVSRNRQLAKVICAYYNCMSLSELPKTLKIYEPTSWGAFNTVLGGKEGFVCSEFYHDVIPGEKKGGVLCQDLRQLTFKDGFFDLVITQDVFEHIERPFEAFDEIFRILTPSGVHAFTIPCIYQTQSREGLPKVFHGDPINDGLVHTDFGLDIVDVLNRRYPEMTTRLFLGEDEPDDLCIIDTWIVKNTAFLSVKNN